MSPSRLQARPTAVTLGVVALLAVTSLLSNITTDAQLSGQQEPLNFLRLTVSKTLNSGTLWAALGFFVGWLHAGRGRTPHLLAALAAAAASLGALAVHYALGNLIGIMELSIWLENYHWFIAAVIFSAPLGWAGSRAAQDDTLGYLLRFLVPLGALAEPFVTYMFWFPSGLSFPWAQVYASY